MAPVEVGDIRVGNHDLSGLGDALFPVAHHLRAGGLEVRASERLDLGGVQVTQEGDLEHQGMALARFQVRAADEIIPGLRQLSPAASIHDHTHMLPGRHRPDGITPGRELLAIERRLLPAEDMARACPVGVGDDGKRL